MCQLREEQATAPANGVPDKALKLARRVAGMQRNEAARHRFEVLMLDDGAWYIIVGDSEEMEYLGKR